MRLFEFILNKSEKIIFIGADQEMEKSVSCDDMLIKFVVSNIELTLYENFVFDGIDRFLRLLNKAIDHKALLPESIYSDLGYLWSQELHENCLEKEDGSWVGLKNLLWPATGNKAGLCTTWLYNDHFGDIILEITPAYRWHFSDPETGDGFITYEEFMQNYQPILFRTIPKDVAKEWLVQLEQLAEKIKFNEDQYSIK